MTSDSGPCCHVWPSTRALARRLIMPDWLAITLGRHVISWRELDDIELAHEVAHVRQWRRHGMRFPLRYLAASRAVARAGGDRYRDNEFEREARAASEAARAARARGPEGGS